VSRKLGIAVSAVLALVFSIAVIYTGRQQDAQATVQVVRTQKFIPVGAEIKPDDLTVVKVPESVAEGMARSVAQVAGKAPRFSLLKGQFVYTEALTDRAYRPGYVTVYVPTDLSSSACVAAGEYADVYIVSKAMEAQEAVLLCEKALVRSVLDQNGNEIDPARRRELTQVASIGGKVPVSVGVEVPRELAKVLAQACSRKAVYLVRSGG